MYNININNAIDPYLTPLNLLSVRPSIRPAKSSLGLKGPSPPQGHQQNSCRSKYKFAISMLHVMTKERQSNLSTLFLPAQVYTK